MREEETEVKGKTKSHDFLLKIHYIEAHPPTTEKFGEVGNDGEWTKTAKKTPELSIKKRPKTGVHLLGRAMSGPGGPQVVKQEIQRGVDKREAFRGKFYTIIFPYLKLIRQ